MSEILQLVLTNLASIIATGGLGGIFYYRLNKRAKAAEVKAAEANVKAQEIANHSADNEEWIKLYNNCIEEKKRLEGILQETSTRMDELYKSKDAAWEKYADCRNECNKKDLVINELNWYRCEVNGCPYRKPPRKYGEMDFPKDAVNPVENPDPDSL